MRCGRSGGPKEARGKREEGDWRGSRRHVGGKRRLLLSLLFQARRRPPHAHTTPHPPPPLGALKCPAFSTHLKPPFALLDAAPSLLKSQSSGKSPPRLLSSFCLPCQWAHTVWGGWREVGGGAGEKASGCKGECTWMGRLPGHAVRGYCPACQQPLAFNGARISSF